MKETPTFADMVLRESFRKKNPHVPTSIRQPLAEARRFVLDDTASAFLADLAHANFGVKAKHSRIIRAMEASRVLARLPHRVCWIEYNPRIEHARTLAAYPEFKNPDGTDHTMDDVEETTTKSGWLLRQEEETLFRASIFSLQKWDDKIILPVMMPYDFVWTTDDQPLPYKPSKEADDNYFRNMAHLATGIPHYDTRSIGYTPNERGEDFTLEQKHETVLELAGELRRILTLLAAINDIPIGVKHVTQSHGFVAQGRYRKFLSHSIITLTLPKGRDPQQVARAIIAMARRRAHQVRGHWRRDWRHEGNRIWVHEHQRGDASLGFVTHDYKVEHPSNSQ
jgi:hypothetical protein